MHSGNRNLRPEPTRRPRNLLPAVNSNKYKNHDGTIQYFLEEENKADLDKGLEKTKEGVFSKLARAVAGKSKVDEEVLDNLEEILISSDVGVDTTVRIIERIEQRVAADKYAEYRR